MHRVVLGIDAGNYNGKTVGEFGTDVFKTNICDWFERDMEETFGKDDMEFMIAGRRGFAGSIAKYEDEFGDGTRYGDSKAHEDTKIRVLLALDRYLNKFCPDVTRVSIVTGQPIKRHQETEKKLIIDMLTDTHEIVVNGKTRTITIDEIGVVPEGAGAFWASPREGKIRILDIGSGTVNASSIIDKRNINNGSDTFNFGIETVSDRNDLEKIARGIIRNTTKLKWEKGDKVLICGGIAREIEQHIKNHYNKAELLSPTLVRNIGNKELHPMYANAVGYYELAKGRFGTGR